MRFVRLLPLNFFMSFFIGIASASSQAATVYVNGKVLTVDDQFSIAEAFMVEDGRFTHVGSNRQILELAEGEPDVIELGGQTVIPGLIDNHNHFIRGAEHWQSLIRLDGIRSREQAVELIRQKAGTLEKDEWLLVLGGWHEDQFTDEPSGFTLEELDAISPDNPVFIQAAYSHAFVNTAFYRFMDIPLKQTQLPDLAPHPVFGPRLPLLAERNQDGHVTSVMGGGIRMVIQVGMRLPEVPPDVSVAALKKAQKYYHSLGITTVYDPAGALINDASYAAIERVHSRGELTLRTFRTTWIQPHDEESTQQALAYLGTVGPFFSGDDFYDTIAVGEAMYLPIHDTIGDEPEFDAATRRDVASIITAILSRGLPVQIHAVNTSTLSFYLDLVEDLSHQYTITPGQLTFTHAEGADKFVLSRLQQLGATIQIRSEGVLHSKKSLIQKSGSPLLGQPQLRTINESGVLWGLGTDGTKAGQINPMITLDWAVNGRAINGDQLLPETQRLTREQALIAHTRNNAVLVGRGDSLGQIRPGFYADFVVLDTDYLSIDTQHIRDIRPVMTVVAGGVVHQK